VRGATLSSTDCAVLLNFSSTLLKVSSVLIVAFSTVGEEDKGVEEAVASDILFLTLSVMSFAFSFSLSITPTLSGRMDAGLLADMREEEEEEVEVEEVEVDICLEGAEPAGFKLRLAVAPALVFLSPS